MPRPEALLLLDHLGALLDARLWDAARPHVRRALELVQNADQAARLLQLCLQVPAELRQEAAWAVLVAAAAARANDPACCEAHLAGQPAGGEALWAWLAMGRGEAEEALALSEQGLAGNFAGLAYRVRAWALAQLGRPGWEEAAREAAQRNAGRQRGICLLNLGAFLSFAGREAEARAACAQAAPCFAHDPELRATALYNVGTACLRLQDFTAAERAYREAMRWARKPGGVRMLPRAWSGLGHLYRVLHEWPRALHAYAASQTKATAPDDIAQAWRGRAHTLRLTGRLDEALTTLYEAFERLGQPERHALHADLAALLVSLGDTLGAAAACNRVPEDREEERQRVQIVRAELARRVGDGAQAAALLDGLSPGALWTREEARLLPELFALVGRAEPVPAPLQLQLNADGPLRATLNGRPLPLPATGPAASLLAFLVWHGGEVDVERSLEALTLPGASERARRQNLSRVVGQLRQLLGWPDAVQNAGGTLRLDLDVVWRPLISPPPERADAFCAGLYDPWVSEWREERRDADILIKT